MLDAHVIAIQHQEVFAGLRGKDALLGQGIVFERAVTVKMVRRDVQDDGDLRTEEFDRFQLEAGNLQDRPGVFLIVGFVDQLDDRHPDIAANLGRETAGF